MIDRLKNRFTELSSRAEKTGTACCTKFLNLAEQSDLYALKLPCTLFGGFEGAERRIAVFGAGCGFVPPIACVRICPASKKFSDELTHRDYLGSLMALGVTREMLGDIIVFEGGAYLFCLETIADFVIENLSEVKRTSVKCERGSPPDTVSGGGSEISLVVPSERLDALIAAVYKLSREDAKAAVEKGLVFVDSRLVTKAGAFLTDGASVTVRGRGRFTFSGTERETKKGRLRVTVKIP